MSNFAALFLTGIITLSTLVYTFYSVRLWRTTQWAAQIALQTAFIQLWVELQRYLDAPGRHSGAEQAFLREFADLHLESIIWNLIAQRPAPDKNRRGEFRQAVADLARKHGVDPGAIRWVRALGITRD